MAEILRFPARPRPDPPVYQLHRFASDGGVRATLIIRARTDAAARHEAHGLAGGARAELWSGGRFLDHFGSADHPIAASIRLLDDPARPDTCAPRAPTLPE